MTPFLSLHLDSTSMSDGDEDMSMRAPYIPMGVGDDYPLLTSTDLMWGALPDKPPSSKTNSSSKSSSWWVHISYREIVFSEFPISVHQLNILSKCTIPWVAACAISRILFFLCVCGGWLNEKFQGPSCSHEAICIRIRCTTPTAAVTKTNLGSSLAQLLCADSRGQGSSRPLPMKCNDHGGGLMDPSDVLGQVVIREHSKSCFLFF